MTYQLKTPSLVHMKPNTQKPLVNLLLSTDKNYIAFTGLAVATFLKYTSPSCFLNIVILHDGSVPREQMEKFGKLSNRNQVENNIVFMDCRNEFPEMDERKTPIPRGMMYRLLLPLIMQNYDRVLYVDADVMAVDDVSSLFTMDMKDAAIAASRDLVVYANCVAGVKIPIRPYMKILVENNEIDNSLPWREYFKKYLGMDKNWGDYVNSGVILFDIKKTLSLGILDNILSDVVRGYIYPDQDILNKYLVKYCLQLSPIWNLHTFKNTFLLPQHVEKFVAKDLVAEYISACDKPKIIHFAGPWKPWKRTDIIHTDKFFNHLFETPWFDEITNQFDLKKMYHIEIRKA
ncbi:MAG: glycosyltransferase family 8 protein [Alphaproteobacteria bacterium]